MAFQEIIVTFLVQWKKTFEGFHLENGGFWFVFHLAAANKEQQALPVLPKPAVKQKLKPPKPDFPTFFDDFLIV